MTNGHRSEIDIIGIFHRQNEFSDRKSTIMPCIRNLRSWPWPWTNGHRSKIDNTEFFLLKKEFSDQKSTIIQNIRNLRLYFWTSQWTRNNTVFHLYSTGIHGYQVHNINVLAFFR
jgi:hypothetical protein